MMSELPHSPRSPKSTIDSFAYDLEIGKHTNSMRSQSHRLSKMIMSRTELMHLNPVAPEPPKASAPEEEETCQLAIYPCS